MIGAGTHSPRRAVYAPCNTPASAATIRRSLHRPGDDASEGAATPEHRPGGRWGRDGARRLLQAAVIALPFLCVAAVDLDGQTACPRGGQDPSLARRVWEPPLDRVVTFQVTEVSLRDALDLLAASAGVRISYSPDLLPISRPVCYQATAAVGEILLHLATGTTTQPVAVAADHIVLSPAVGRVPLPPSLAGVIPLERVLVSGSPGGAARRGLAVAVEVLSGDAIGDAPGRGTVGSLLNASVPGMWVWDQAPVSLLLRYASIRGASSFGASYPKIYIDGVEVANPLLLRRLIPETVDQIEVIRGPQGAALHGMDAISGVINIVTRQGGSSGGSPEILFRSEVGAAESAFRSAASLAHEHAAALRLGTGTRSGGLDMELGNYGHIVPDASTRYFNTGANFRIVGATSVVTSVFRLAHEHASAGGSPLLRELRAQTNPSAETADLDQRVLQYTVGLRARLYPEGRWDHTLVAGVDGDRISGVPDDRTPLPVGAESWMAMADGGADRVTLRASSVGRFELGTSTELRLSVLGEHSTAWERSFESIAGPVGSGESTEVALHMHDQSVGLVGLTDISVNDRFYGTLGGRIEHRVAVGELASILFLPVLGGAYVIEEGGLTAKIRAAYGRGTRPVRALIRGMTWPGSYAQIRDPGLRPEEQTGIEGGIDLSIGRVMAVQFTAFDQLASNLVQRVGIRVPDDGDPLRPRPWRVHYALQNLGEISNRGWEFDASALVFESRIAAGVSKVDSRVEKVASGYLGDLRPGDRMLEVPRWTYNLGLSRAVGPMFFDVAAYRAADWINYDRTALANDFNAPDATREQFTGQNLRTYWRRHDGATRLSVSVDLALRPGLSVVLAGDNLLDEQIGEPDNTSVVPGRSITVGMRARF